MTAKILFFFITFGASGFAIAVEESPDEKKTEAPSEAPKPNIAGSDLSNALKVEAISVTVPGYHYSSSGRENPFIPPFGEDVTNVTASIEIPIVSPLQVELSELSVAGLMQLDDLSWRALILTKNNEGILAKVGDPIGLTGKITDINSQRVLTRQFIFRKVDDASAENADTQLRDYRDVALEPEKEQAVAKSGLQGMEKSPPLKQIEGSPMPADIGLSSREKSPIPLPDLHPAVTMPQESL